MAALKLPLILVLLLLAMDCSAFYGRGSDVIELTASNFDELVTKGHETWIVQFFAPWCRHSKSFAPEYQKAATRLKGKVKVGAVNSDEQKSLTKRFNVRGFPTVKIFSPNKYSPEEYNGQRTAQGLVDATVSAIKLK